MWGINKGIFFINVRCYIKLHLFIYYGQVIIWGKIYINYTFKFKYNSIWEDVMHLWNYDKHSMWTEALYLLPFAHDIRKLD